MNEAQKQALIHLSATLSKHWTELPLDVVNAWEHFENVTPDGTFRRELRGKS